MEYNYPENTKESNITYMRTREGPNSFRVYYKNAARFVFTPKQVGAVFGIAKFGSKEDKEDENYLKYIEKHGFGPEVHGEPNESTKMVV
jgi:hypothetical protein